MAVVHIRRPTPGCWDLGQPQAEWDAVPSTWMCSRSQSWRTSAPALRGPHSDGAQSIVATASLGRRESSCPPAGHEQGGLGLPGSTLGMGPSKARMAGAQRGGRMGRSSYKRCSSFREAGCGSTIVPLVLGTLSTPICPSGPSCHPATRSGSGLPRTISHLSLGIIPTTTSESRLSPSVTEAPPRALSALSPLRSPPSLLRGRASQIAKPIMSLPCSQPSCGS